MNSYSQIQEFLQSNASGVVVNVLGSVFAAIILFLTGFFLRKVPISIFNQTIGRCIRNKQIVAHEILGRRKLLGSILGNIVEKGKEIQRNALIILGEYKVIAKMVGDVQKSSTIRVVLGECLNRINSGKKIRVLNDRVKFEKLILELTNLNKPVSADIAKARTFINSCGEKIDSGYEASNDEQSFLSDLEKECVHRIISQVSAWGNSIEGQLPHMHEDGCRVLLMGGMRATFASRIVEAIATALECELFVCLHKESILQEQIDAMRKIAEVENEKHIGFSIVSDNDADARTGYDIIVCTHHWQHRELEEFDLGKAKFHLRDDGGLLIWFSALSRGANVDDVECVCEGLPPSEPNPIEKDVVLSAKGDRQYGVVIPYTRMDGFERGKGKICYWPLDDNVWGGKIFYGAYFPRSFEASIRDLERDFCDVTCDFLRWYFSENSDIRIGEHVTEISSLESGMCGTRIFNDVRYVICSVGYDLNDGRGERQQYLLATISVADSKRRCLVTLYPCVKDPPCKWSVLTRERLSSLLCDEKFSDQHEADSRQYNFCDDKQLVCKVISKIKCPESKHYMFVLDVSRKDRDGSILYRTCLPSRTYIPVGVYDRVRKMAITDYDDRIRKFTGDQQRFQPCRKDAVTILRPYYGIKSTLQKMYSVYVDEQTVFFHKCYGCLEEVDVQVLKLNNVEPVIRNALMSNSVNIAKDKAFNELPLGKRLVMLGGMNVHDVLLFGVKHVGHIKEKTK